MTDARRYRDGVRLGLATIDGPPRGQCEHAYLAGNCPFCALGQTRAQLSEVAELLRASERDVAKLTRKLTDAEVRVSALTHQVSMLKSWRARRDKVDRVGERKAQLNALRCALARRDAELRRLRGRVPT